jgi:flagellar M-ring protein FliF
MEIDQTMINAVAMASGIPVEKIVVLGYIIPMFEASSGDGDFVQKWPPIIVAVLILALLGFMVWRSLRPVEINEVEPELSVEELLSATREKQAPVEDIDLEEKSETRKAIEKFVDENPESAALLLRNWPNDDWD